MSTNVKTEEVKINETTQLIKKPKGRYILDVCICLYLACCLGIDFGINKPSVQPFVESPPTSNPPGLGSTATFYSLVVACYSIGEFSGSIIFGLLSNTKLGFKRVFYISTVIGIIGSCFYCIALKGWMALLGRLLQGIWAGAINTSLRSYVTKTTKRQNIGKFITTITFLATFSALASSGLVGLMGDINLVYRDIRFDAYRAPGWILSALGVFTLFIILLFRESAEEGVLDPKDDLKKDPFDNRKKKMKENSSIFNFPEGLNWILLISLIFVFFSCTVGLSLNETILTPLARDSFGMDVKATSYVFLMGGVTNAICFPILIFLQNFYPAKVKSARVTFIAIFMCILSSIIWTDWNSIIYMNKDPCQKFTCTFSLDDSIICSANQTESACQHFGPQCVWMMNGLHGPCTSCPRVCRDPAKSLSIYQLYIGNMLLAVGFTMGRAASSGLYSEQLQGKANGLLQGLMLSTGSVGRVVAPLFSVYLYELVNSTYILMPVVCFLFIISGICLFISLRFHQNRQKITLVPNEIEQ